eukprot:12999627-Alexandrium_andersonii.AAC.1
MGRTPTPSWTRLRSRPRQRAEQSSPGPGICRTSETPPHCWPQPLGAPRDVRHSQGWALWS